MAAFDRAKWLKRARTDRELTVIESLEKTIAWARSLEITVEFRKTSDGQFHSASRRVEIASRIKPEVQLYILLHELGHFLIEEDGPETVDYKYPNGYRRIEKNIPGRNLLHKVDVIAEEFEAWDRGRLLAEMLGLDIDREAYDKTRARYLQSYFRWALRRGRVKDD